MNIKRTVLVGAAVAATAVGGAGGLGVASAATASDSSTSDTSIVDKIASKFHLNKSDVQAVFDADRKEHQAEREAQQKEQLAQAVKDGKLTQTQADHITSVLNEIKTLRGNTDPHNLSDDVRSQIKDKMDALRDWAKENNIDMHYVMVGHGPHGPGMGMMGDREAANQ
jgi:hypothetical protein